MIGFIGQSRRPDRALNVAALRGRLRAWWDGEAWTPDEPGAAAPAGSLGDPLPLSDTDLPYWTPERIEAAQRVWGPEHLAPGGDAYIRDLLKPLALDPSLTVAEIGCGLGTALRMMHRSFNVWPKGFEASTELLEAGHAFSTRAGLAKKIPVAAFDPERPEFKKGSFDRIIARDLVHTLRDKDGFLRAVKTGLKKRGQLLLTDFVLRDGGPASAAVADWAEREPVPSRPWTVDALTGCLEEMKFNLHIIEDETDRLISMILADWKALQSVLRTIQLPPAVTAAMLDEGERWARCAAALDSGQLRHYRIIVSRGG